MSLFIMLYKQIFSVVNQNKYFILINGEKKNNKMNNRDIFSPKTPFDNVIELAVLVLAPE